MKKKLTNAFRRIFYCPNFEVLILLTRFCEYCRQLDYPAVRPDASDVQQLCPNYQYAVVYLLALTQLPRIHLTTVVLCE